MLAAPDRGCVKLCCVHLSLGPGRLSCTWHSRLPQLQVLPSRKPVSGLQRRRLQLLPVLPLPGCKLRRRLRQLAAATQAAAAEGISLNKAGWAVLHEGQLQPPPISKSDEQFAKENLQFVDSLDDINLAELNDLFEKVGFPRRDPAKMALALQHTHCVLWIRCTKGSRWAKLGQLLGFARATSDGALSATIWDVAVNPSWQRVGLGRAMIERLTARLVEDGISTVTLYAEPTVVGLYEKLGFMKDPDGIRGMAFQRKSKAGKALIERTNQAAEVLLTGR